MAPVLNDDVYFPPLEDCLRGETVILSWKLVATALSDRTGTLQAADAVRGFLSNSYVQRFFEKPSTAFSVSANNGSAEFETRTSAINVTPNTNGKYDIKIIKEDAKWLSKNVKINLMAALRIVAIEFQSRPASHLQGPLSLQDTMHLQDAAGDSQNNSASRNAAFDDSGSLDADTLWNTFQEEESRRRRLFATFLSEKQHFFMAASYVHSVMLYGRLPWPTETKLLVDLYEHYKLGAMHDKTPRHDRELAEKILMGYLEIMLGLNAELDSGLESLTDDKLFENEATNQSWCHMILKVALSTSEVIFQALDYDEQQSAVHPQMVGQWFEAMIPHCFFDALPVINSACTSTQLALQSLSCAVTMKFLSPETALPRIARTSEDNQNEELYLQVPAIMETIHGCIGFASDRDSPASYPVILLWSLILLRLHQSLSERSDRRDQLDHERSERELLRPSAQRRSSAGSMVSLEVSPYDEFVRSQGLDKDTRLIETFAFQTTREGQVYNVLGEMALQAGLSEDAAFSPLLGWRIRATFLGFLMITYQLVGYQSEPFSCLLNVLSGNASYWDVTEDSGASDILMTALGDERFLEQYFAEALNRYPFENAPFIHLCQALARCTADHQTLANQDILVEILRRTPTLTFSLPAGFQQFELADEAENTNTFMLTADLHLVTPIPRSRRQAGGDSFVIPAGTKGRLVTDTGMVAHMSFEHSAMALMGRRLQVFLNKSDYSYQVLESLSTDEVAAIIGLLATLIRAETVRGSPRIAVEIVDEAGKSLLGKDILVVVCDILDSWLQNDDGLADGSSLVILTACLQFLHAVLPLYPGRVLSYMARCNLLNYDAKAGKLARLTGNLDMAAPQFDFLVSTVRLLSGALDAIMVTSIRRKCGGNALTSTSGRNKTSGSDDGWLLTAEKPLAKLGSAIAEAAVDVVENASTWKFKSADYPTLIMRDVIPIMNSLILYAFGTEEPEGDSSRPTECLAPGAQYIIDSFLSAPSSSLRFQALLSALYTGYDAEETHLRPNQALTLNKQVAAVLELATTLLRVANLQEQPANRFESQLFKSSCILARLPGINAAYKRPTLSLLKALVTSAGENCKEPPSLLGFLGPQVATSFLDVLSALDKPFCVIDEVTSTWGFFSAVIRNRQQWLSNCLISGRTPREVSDSAQVRESSADSVFAVALRETKRAALQQNGARPQQEVLAILDFLTSAQNFWPWTVFSILKDPECLDGLRAQLTRLPASASKGKQNPLGAAYDARQAAYIAEAFAMQLYHQRHMGNAKTAAEKLVRDLDYYLRDGALVAGYNASLHVNFAKNFANKYPSCSVDGFKRTSLQPRDMGDNYYYDLGRADKMLQFDAGWRGPRNNGFRAEMERANLNLSLVDAQISLCHAWEFLLLEISSCLPKEEVVATQMHQVALQCLEANRDSQGLENIFTRIIHSRAEFALQLIQRLVRIKISVPFLADLLASIYSSIIGVEDPFSEENVSVYRMLLQALYITLAAFAARVKEAPTEIDPDNVVKMTQASLNILDRVVGRGFRTLVTLVHEKDVADSSDDLALIIAVLQACLAMPDMDQQQTQILNILAAHNAVHVACSLYSWSDKMLAPDNDPIYGELSLIFLVELSKMPAIAEQLACDGVVGQISSANLTQFMRKGGISPVSEQTSAARCYGIWTKAMLPLLLNLLTSMGATIAPEIAYVLNQFPGLLQASVDRFEGPGASRTVTKGREAKHYVSLLAVTEVHNLGLLTRVLAALRVNNNRDIPEVKWDAQSLAEYVDFWLTTRRVLRERLLPIGAREADWKGMKARREGCENLLEEKVVAEMEAARDVLGEVS